MYSGTDNHNTLQPIKAPKEDNVTTQRAHNITSLPPNKDIYKLGLSSSKTKKGITERHVNHISSMPPPYILLSKHKLEREKVAMVTTEFVLKP
uniref:Uncharacterized protein n=1 Tax=Arundo donax TaxID=35708 RepID=A0A0A9F6K9_ARUDO